MKTFNEVLTEAVRDLSENGYDSQERLERWMYQLRYAANYDLPSQDELERRLAESLKAVFRRNVNGGLMKYHPSLPRFTLQQITPSLHAELNRRILASANLIKLNREQAVDKTLQRFSGWATSIPAGGSKVVDKIEIKTDIKKSLRQVNYEVRRVDIDQGHKLISSINAVIAQESGAIAMMWRDRGSTDKSYNARHSHLARNGKVYAIRDSWAVKEGLINKGAGYTDDMTAPAFEPFCSCWGVYYISPRELPEEMLTAKGREWLESKRK